MPARPGFSLVELLLVVAVIAVLIGILLPVLGAARSAGRAAACLANIQQLAVVTHAYATDGDEFFINYRDPNTQSAHRIWDRPALRDDGTPGEWWSSRLVRRSYLPSAQPLLCPAFETSHGLARDANINVSDDPTKAAADPLGVGPASVRWNKVHYGINVRFLASRQGWAFPEGNPWNLPPAEGPFDQTPRMSEIADPANTISHTDSKNRAWEIITTQQTAINPSAEVVVEGIGYLFPAYDPPEIQFGYSHARHRQAIHVGWADGHGSSVAVADVDNPYVVDELTSVPDHPDDNRWDLR